MEVDIFCDHDEWENKSAKHKKALNKTCSNQMDHKDFSQFISIYI